MIVKNAKYELTAVKPEQYPVKNMPEITFGGRSNVGKSSIINALLNRKNLARVGATPGKTREINFYNVDDVLYLVDLPGYGFANVSKDVKISWGKFIETYLSTRQQLVLIILLVDIRHTPSQDDKLMYEWITSYNLPHMIVATKVDKITRAQYNPRVEDIRKTLGLEPGIKVIPFSSETKQGRDEVWNEIDNLIKVE